MLLGVCSNEDKEGRGLNGTKAVSKQKGRGQYFQQAVDSKSWAVSFKFLPRGGWVVTSMEACQVTRP